MSIATLTGDEKVQEGIAALVDTLGLVGTVSLDVEDRSRIITAVRKVDDEIRANADIDDVLAAFGVLRGAIADLPRDVVQEIQQGLGEALRKWWLAAIDARGMSQTGRYRNDVEQAAVRAFGGG